MKKSVRLVLGLFAAFSLAVPASITPLGIQSAVAATETVSEAGGTDCTQTVGNATGVEVEKVEVSTVNYCVVKFARVGDTTWTIPAGVSTIDYLVVGGGGGGGAGTDNAHGGGGGGGGGVLTGSIASLSGIVSIGVGDGGAAGTWVGNTNNPSGNGGDSFLADVRAKGGGGGGSYRTLAQVGGSGGGGAPSDVSGRRTGAVGTDDQGTKGGNALGTSSTLANAGGGGGSGTAGSDGAEGEATGVGGAGGDGREVSILGAPEVYGGGGGGAGFSSGGSGGSGGGGGGGRHTLFGDAFATAGSGEEGVAGLGGGGGGGMASDGITGDRAGNRWPGGKGGSGVVIVRYALSTATPTFGTPNPTANGFTVQISNYNANFTWSGSATVGTVVISPTGLVTVTGVPAGTSSTVTISVTRSGFATQSANVAASAQAPSGTNTQAPSSPPPSRPSQPPAASTQAPSGTNTQTPGSRPSSRPSQPPQTQGSAPPSAGTTSRSPILTAPTSSPSGPVLRNGVIPMPPATPFGTVNGALTPLSIRVTDPNTLDLRAGALSIRVGVTSGNGLVRQGSNGATEVQLRSGGAATVTGTGLAPRANAQVYLLTRGQETRQLANTPTDDAGAFSSEAVFATSLQDPPIPVGRHTMQVVTLDQQGRQIVVEFAVNIAQPGPAPEPNRQVGEIPQLTPGQSLATNAGIPEAVTLSVLQDQQQAFIEGAGWSMAVDVTDSLAGVQEPTPGSLLLELTRGRETRIFGSGFMPSTRADVWLFSEPTLLGTVEVNGEGNFSGVVTIDDRLVAPGEHTLQLQAIGEDGFVRAVNLGVVVNDEQPVAATEEQARGLMWPLGALGAVALAAIVGLWLWSRLRRNART